MSENNEIRKLEPKALWNHFADLNAIPRASKKEARVISFVKAFGEGLGLRTSVDEAGNVLIKKPATRGMEDRLPVVLQSHLDMVHQKNANTDFDFNTQGIEMYVDGDWVRARGTTLGADNGLGVSAIMSLLASTDIPHPELNALFTIDEETGMTGALALKGGLLDGRILLNLDTEEDNELTIGCAGGVDVTATGNYNLVPASKSMACRVSLTGLTGGHSGMDIHKGRANANKLVARFLNALSSVCKFELAGIDGGGLRNAIPRECFADILIADADQSLFESEVKKFYQLLQHEYKTTDPGLQFRMDAVARPDAVLQSDFQYTFLRCLYACPNGIYRMSPDIEGLVQTSNNLARVLVKDGRFSIQCLTRSSVDSEKNDLAQMIASIFQLAGAEISFAGAYPGWTPEPDSGIVKLMSGIYSRRFGEAPQVKACHAGLECGILGTNYPGMQMISFGPTIRGAHSPDEKALIPSVQKFWGFLLETLSQIPMKQAQV
ncbi:MAG TPA: aminoacyl-histidine dipeptidase [Saprospiraceae bacterium]|nr:aminoacyl-histidine dipeptidase [Saprospiraceae bacterium]